MSPESLSNVAMQRSIASAINARDVPTVATPVVNPTRPLSPLAGVEVGQDEVDNELGRQHGLAAQESARQRTAVHGSIEEQLAAGGTPALDDQHTTNAGHYSPFSETRPASTTYPSLPRRGSAKSGAIKSRSPATTCEEKVTYRSKLPSAESILKGAMAATIDMQAGAPSSSVTITDSTWNLEPEGPFQSGDVYGIIMTRTGAQVYSCTHKLGIVTDASSFSEAVGTGKGGEVSECGRNIETGLGVPPTGPTLMLTDNRANALVGSGQGTLRSRHALRRYCCFLQRVKSGDVTLRYLPDLENPADCLTKPVPATKANFSKRWIMGRPRA